ncbi:hypothetical protein ACFL2C_01995 [Patescibacteria group bacterium]
MPADAPAPAVPVVDEKPAVPDVPAPAAPVGDTPAPVTDMPADAPVPEKQPGGENPGGQPAV